jgi:A/G-specific adenine glycosylase
MTDPSASAFFAPTLVRWQRAHGRLALPWQNTRDPYRVWLSEIMLQQTQVQTVLGFYERFLRSFPTVQALASAPLDEVLGLWSGLGYYSRARNLHRCAQTVSDVHAGQFPSSAAQLQQLPGIGPSTAAAIAAFCFGERVSIMDGNVRRVLARFLAFTGDLSQSRAQQDLSHLAEQLLPQTPVEPLDGHGTMVAYTQGLMDLGALVCTPRKPSCHTCPLQTRCQAKALGRENDLPVKSKKTKRSSESLFLLWPVDAQSRVFLVKRPSSGVWSGLYAPAVFRSESELMAALSDHGHLAQVQAHPAQRHVLTHKDLHLHRFELRWSVADHGPVPLGQVHGGESGKWASASEAHLLGLPAPVKQWLSQLRGA